MSPRDLNVGAGASAAGGGLDVVASSGDGILVQCGGKPSGGEGERRI